VHYDNFGAPFIAQQIRDVRSDEARSACYQDLLIFQVGHNSLQSPQRQSAALVTLPFAAWHPPARPRLPRPAPIAFLHRLAATVMTGNRPARLGPRFDVA